MIKQFGQKSCRKSFRPSNLNRKSVLSSSKPSFLKRPDNSEFINNLNNTIKDTTKYLQNGTSNSSDIVSLTNRHKFKSKSSSWINSNNADMNVDENDIINIDKRIKEKLYKEMMDVQILKDTISTLIWIISHGYHDQDKLDAKNKLNTIKSELIDIERGSKLLLYILRTNEYIEKYKSVDAIIKPKTFSKKYTCDPVILAEKNTIIVAFLRIAQDYINIKSYSYKSSKYVCNCGSSEFDDGQDDSIICKKCSTICYNLEEGLSYRDSNRVNMTNRYKYSCENHFIDAMNCFEGRHHADNIGETKNLIIYELSLLSVKEFDPNKTSKQLIYMILNEKKMSEHYKDINLLHFLITNNPCPNISAYRDELLDMHKFVEDAYAIIDRISERTNSINVNFKLYKLLQLVDYECMKDDFYFLKTGDKQREHCEIWKNIIDYLKMTFPDATTSNGKKRWRHIRTV